MSTIPSIYLLSAEFNDLYRAFPKGLPLAANAPVSHTLVLQPYLNEDVPARPKKQFFMDCDKMNDELIQYVMKASQGNSSLI